MLEPGVFLLCSPSTSKWSSKGAGHSGGGEPAGSLRVLPPPRVKCISQSEGHLPAYCEVSCPYANLRRCTARGRQQIALEYLGILVPSQAPK